MRRGRRWITRYVVGFGALAVGCDKPLPAVTNDASAPSTASTASTASSPTNAEPLDVTTFRAKYAIKSGPSRSTHDGAQVKVRGYAETAGPKVVSIVGSPTETLPFVWCLVAEKPTWVVDGVMVLAEGKASEGKIVDCKLTKL